MLNRVVDWAKGDPILARKLKAMCDEIFAARNWSISGNAKYVKTKTGHALWVGGTSTTNTSWSLSVSGTTVTVSPGLIYHANNTPVEIEEQDVLIGGGSEDSPHYIALEYDYGSRTGFIYDTSFASLPQPEPPDIYRCAIATVYRSSPTSVQIVRRNRTNDIDVPGWG